MVNLRLEPGLLTIKPMPSVIASVLAIYPLNVRLDMTPKYLSTIGEFCAFKESSDVCYFLQDYSLVEYRPQR